MDMDLDIDMDIDMDMGNMQDGKVRVCKIGERTIEPLLAGLTSI